MDSSSKIPEYNLKDHFPSDWAPMPRAPSTTSVVYGSGGSHTEKIEKLQERMGLLESAMIAWEKRYETKLKEHEETVDMLLEALKNATK